jgi:hypothetical protein
LRQPDAEAPNLRSARMSGRRTALSSRFVNALREWNAGVE